MPRNQWVSKSSAGVSPPRLSPDEGIAEAAGVSVSGLVKTFVRRNGEEVRAVDDITLEVAQGEFLVLLGPSGCGKTTLLRLIAGLEQPNAGRVSIGGVKVYDAADKTYVEPENRPFSMVFQSYALWPHMSAYDNVAYPLRSRRVNRDEERRRVNAVLDMAGVGGLGDQFPAHMSGGQQQRIALARAVVAGEATILFDEPLSNVDAKVRDRLRIEILAMQRDLGFTAIYVTHDQEEAMTLATRVAVLRAGRIAQLGTPREVYERPASRYVASFVGAADELQGHVVAVGGEFVEVETEIGRMQVRSCAEFDAGVEVTIIVRPESWLISDHGNTKPNHVRGVVEASLFLGGSRTEYVVSVGRSRFRVWDTGGGGLNTGEDIDLSVSPDRVLLFAGE